MKGLRLLVEDGNKSFGTITNTFEAAEEYFDRIDSLKAIIPLLNKIGTGVSDKTIAFRDFHGVGPAQYGGGKWLYLSSVNERGEEEPYWFIQSTKYPEYPSLAEFSFKYLFYTDDKLNIASLNIPQFGLASEIDVKNFKANFEALFSITYENWSSKFGNQFNMAIYTG
jgi:hypothetical protein